MPTPVQLTHRSRKALGFLLVAVFAVAILAPSAQAGSVSRGPSLLTLHPGEQGPAVKKLQRMLAGLGYPIKPDGQFGPHTATMVRTLRADAGLDRSARVTKRFLNVLRRAQRGGPGDRRWLGIRRLRLGAQGKDVRLLQNALTSARLPRGHGWRVRAGDATERAPLRARGRVARRRRALAARGAHAQAGGSLGPHGRRGLAARHAGRQHHELVDQRLDRDDDPRHARPTSRRARPLRAPPGVAQIGGDGLAIAPAGAISEQDALKHI